MEMWQIVLGIIFSVITILLGVYVSFTVREKGPILSNSYLWLSKEQRKHADKKAEYRLVSIVFGGLCCFALFYTIYIFSLLETFRIVALLFLAFDVVYAIVESVKSEKSKR